VDALGHLGVELVLVGEDVDVEVAVASVVRTWQ
jgi:hypothetical protein